MGFNIPGTYLKPGNVLGFMEKWAELPSADDIDKADEIEMEEFLKKTEDLIYKLHKQMMIYSNILYVSF